MGISTKKIQSDFINAIQGHTDEISKYIFLNFELLFKISHKTYSFRDISDPVFFLHPVYTHTHN